jgi:hypothetical protein
MTSHRIRNARPADVPEVFAMVCELAEYEKARHEVQSNEELFTEALFCDEPAGGAPFSSTTRRTRRPMTMTAG